MSLSDITLVTATPSDYFAIAKLADICFAHEEFGIVAFGPNRMTPAGTERQAKRMARPPQPGETKYEMKAVTVQSDGTEEIVGFASWIICVGRGGSEEEKARLGTKEGWAQEEKEKAEKAEKKDVKGNEEEGFGNPKILKDVGGKIDTILAKSTEGKDYMTLSLLIVAPAYQRRGIGALLFQDGLKVADEAGLQVVLGASDQGVGLYKKHGCVEVEVMKTNLWEYDGGEGLGVTTHRMLHRSAVS